MTRSQVRTVLLEVLAEVQDAVTDTPVVIDDDTRPIGDLPTFDSWLAEDTTVTLFERLDLEVTDDPNPFIRPTGGAACFREVVATVCELVGATEDA
jgi:hypothetical protein